MLMRTLTCSLLLVALAARADDPPSSAPATAPSPRARPTGPRPPPPPDPATAPDDGRPKAVFATEARWEIAGYNNEEIIYTIIVTSHDARIIRCSTELKGYYLENGEKHSVADRQTTTVFPGQAVQVGNWMGMDKNSGATYSTVCRAV
jgi:hypothetical protein